MGHLTVLSRAFQLLVGQRERLTHRSLFFLNRPLPQVSQIRTGEKVTKEWVLHDWPSRHEQLIDFATCGMPLGYTFDRNCEVTLHLYRGSSNFRKEYVGLWGSIKNMGTPNYKAAMNLTVTSKSGVQYLKDHYVNFGKTFDFDFIPIATEFIPHKRNGALVIQEKNLHLFITLEPIYFRNRPTVLEILEPKSEQSETRIAVSVQQTLWVENVCKFLDEIEEKKKLSGFEDSEVVAGVPEDILKLLRQSLQNSMEKADVEWTLSQYCTTDNMFQLYDVARRCGFQKATQNISKFIKRNI